MEDRYSNIVWMNNCRPSTPICAIATGLAPFALSRTMTSLWLVCRIAYFTVLAATVRRS
jgi:hypothetical protein